MRVQKTEKGPFFLLFPHHYVGGGIGGSGGQCSSNQDCVVSAPFCSKWGYCQVLIIDDNSDVSKSLMIHSQSNCLNGNNGRGGGCGGGGGGGG